MIEGRAGLTGLDDAVQNWESGIELTVLRCTFFRNFCAVSALQSLLTRCSLANHESIRDLSGAWECSTPGRSLQQYRTQTLYKT